MSQTVDQHFQSIETKLQLNLTLLDQPTTEFCLEANSFFSFFYFLQKRKISKMWEGVE